MRKIPVRPVSKVEGDTPYTAMRKRRDAWQGVALDLALRNAKLTARVKALLDSSDNDDDGDDEDVDEDESC